jgi:hypothetical protein
MCITEEQIVEIPFVTSAGNAFKRRDGDIEMEEWR